MEFRWHKIAWLVVLTFAATLFARDLCYVVQNGGKTMQAVVDERDRNDAPAIFQWVDQAAVWLMSSDGRVRIAPRLSIGL